MVFNLSQEEVIKVCSSCDRFMKQSESCRVAETREIKTLKELHRCPKWDEFYGGPCLYR